ncbi:MAG: hypothetical protein ACYCZ0_00530 [Minisyncoccota bacterium]
MALSDDTVQKFREIYEKGGKKISDADAREAAENLAGFFKILWDCSQHEARLERRLKTEPDGFPVDGSYSCLVCGNGINETTGWYHWGGPRCLLCHKAIKDGVVPSFVLKHRDSYFCMWKLKYSFEIKSQTAKKYIREGKLHPRIILNENGTVHEYIFLKKENLALVERYNPIRKSYDRNRAKVAAKWGREMREKFKAERTKNRTGRGKSRT